MSNKFFQKISGIEYTDYTVNPLRARVKPEYLEQLGLKPSKVGWFCEKPDPEGTCKHCWAETLNKIFGNGLAYDKSNRQYIEWYLVEKYLDQLLEFNETKPESVKNPGNPAMVFCHDTIDLFQPSIPNDLRDKYFDAYDQCENLVLQIQSTYPWAQADYFNSRYKNSVPKQFWVGMSAGNQRWLNRYSPKLLSIRASIRYVIFEPMLGPVSLAPWTEEGLECQYCLDWKGIEEDCKRVYTDDGEDWYFECPQCSEAAAHVPIDETLGDRMGFNHIICGGESGGNARPMRLKWLESIIQQCKAAQVPVFVKQLGGHITDSDQEWMRHYGGKIIHERKGGDWDEWPELFRIREFPQIGL